MEYVHRQNVKASFESIKDEATENYPVAWAKEFSVEDNMPTSFTLANNQIVSLPISKKDLKMLEDVGERLEICSWQLEWRIEGSEIVEISPPEFHATLNTELIDVALYQLKESHWDPANVETTLSHLSLYRPVEPKDDVDYDGQLNLVRGARCNVENYSGSFATLVLQVPVVGGHRGGEFRLRNRTNQSAVFSTYRNSNRLYHVSVFHDDCQEFIEPITKGYRLEFVYNLRYKTAENSFVQPNLEESLSSPLNRTWQLPVEPLSTEDGAKLSKKQEQFRALFKFWNTKCHRRLQLVIPLDHSYGNRLSFRFLKGMDQTTAELVTSLLGDIVEIHLAIAKKYIGYNEEDWITSGKEVTKRKVGDRLQVAERDWTEYWLGNWVDRQDRQLILPPTPFIVPDELLGSEDVVFQPIPTEILEAKKYSGYTFERAVMVIWPRKQTFPRSLIFGLDQALDVLEAGLETDSNTSINDTVKNRMQHILDYCKREPNKSWFASSAECSDLRCDRARLVSPKVASERALRLINICLRWNLLDSGLELLRVLFSDFERTDYRCCKCSNSNDGVVFVGGICSNSVAEGIAKLVTLLGWDSAFVLNCIGQVIQTNRLSKMKQTGQLAFFASCLFHHQYFEAAIYICDHVYSILIDIYLKESIETRTGESVVSSCIEMLYLIDGPPFSEHSRLNQLLFRLKSLSVHHSSTVLGWLQLINSNLLKSLECYLNFYKNLVAGLESHLATFESPSYRHLPSLTHIEKAAAQLITSYLRLEDDVMLNKLIERVTKSPSVESRSTLSALLASRWIWAVPSTPMVENVLNELSGARFQQLGRFKFQVFKWEQPDAILKEHPIVESFLRSKEESMTYSNFNSEAEAHAFAKQFFGCSSSPVGYSATVVGIGCDTEGVVFAKIRKTPEIYESSLKQLEIVERILNYPTTPQASISTPSTGSLTPDSNHSGSPSVVVKRSSKRKTLDSSDVHSKRSKKTSKANCNETVA